PQPWDSNPLKTTPTTTLGPDRYLANSLSSPRPSLPITAHQRHQPPPPAASPAITAHHCLSPPQPPPLAASPGHHHHDHHISASLGYHTAHSHHISAGTTRHPRPMPRPPSCITITHHCRPNLRMPHPAPAPSSPHRHHMSLHFQYKTSAPHDMSQPHPALRGPQVSPQAPAPLLATGTWA
ncbi:hypothetical protein C0993_011056, partial [Termitomyces sp. T159_Od127]